MLDMLANADHLLCMSHYHAEAGLQSEAWSVQCHMSFSCLAGGSLDSREITWQLIAKKVKVQSHRLQVPQIF